MTAALFASDLDRTLIYSAAALDLTGPDAAAPRLLCVEVYQGAPLSYLTEHAAELLAELGTLGRFVPVTTRTREQYARIRLPGPPPRYAICANGGHLLVDGESDATWHARVRRRLTECAPLCEVRARLLREADDGWVHKARTAEELFTYLVVDRDRLPDGWLAELTDWATPRGWRISQQGRKIYAVPTPLTKQAAVTEVLHRSGTPRPRLYAAGDSLLDADLLTAADAGWLPGHGELAASGWQSAHLTRLTERGVRAGERIAAAAHAAVTGKWGAPVRS